jgi:hypothetical protein
MKRIKLAYLAPLALVVCGAIGCDNSDTATTKPSPYAAYQPTSGQNIAPGLAPYTHGDPNWPMDAGQAGGGGGKR